jgi:hypothetical protein
VKSASALTHKRKKQAIQHTISLYEDWDKLDQIAKYEGILREWQVPAQAP